MYFVIVCWLTSYGLNPWLIYRKIIWIIWYYILCIWIYTQLAPEYTHTHTHTHTALNTNKQVHPCKQIFKRLKSLCAYEHAQICKASRVYSVTLGVYHTSTQPGSPFLAVFGETLIAHPWCALPRRRLRPGSDSVCFDVKWVVWNPRVSERV